MYLTACARTVKVIKLISKDSIEDCILQLGHKKLKLEQDMTAAEQGEITCTHANINLCFHLCTSTYNEYIKEKKSHISKVNIKLIKIIIAIFYVVINTDTTHFFSTFFFLYLNVFSENKFIFTKYLMVERVFSQFKMGKVYQMFKD